MRVASVPEDEFERAVESDCPTVTQMAERGTRKTIIDLLEDRDPKDFQAATAAQGQTSPQLRGPKFEPGGAVAGMA